MTVSPEPLPTPRIGDAERDDAINLLQEHMAAGRLDNAEFNDRMNTALQARTMGDLTPLFTDLPGRRPGQQVAKPEPKAATPEPVSSKSDAVMKRIGTIVISLLWPLAIIFNLATGFEWWWTWLIPVFGSGVIAKVFGLVGNDDDQHRHDRLQHHHDHRQLRTEQRFDRLDQRMNRPRDHDDE